MNENLSDYERREKALKTLNNLAGLVEHYGIKHHEKGLELAAELIKIDEDAYTEGLDDGRELARNELDPILKEVIVALKVGNFTMMGRYTIEDIERAITR